MSEGVFPLSEIVPAWTGSRILRLEAPIRAGIAGLRADCARAAGLVFVLVSEFDYDGILESIEALAPVATEGDLKGSAAEALQTVEQRYLDASWPAFRDDARPVDVLPATFNRLLGRFPDQLHGRFSCHNTYEFLYLRSYALAAERGDVVDQLFGLTGLQQPIVEALGRRGGEG